MARVAIPQNKRWIGQVKGEVFGNIWASKNLSLERSEGKINLAESLTGIFTETDDAQLTTPVQFVRTAADNTDRWWALGGALFKTTNTNPEVGFTQDAIGSSPLDGVYDMIEFQDELLVALETNIDRLTGGTWTADWWTGTVSGSALTTAKPHRFAIHAGAVIFTDGRFVNSWDGTIATDPALTLPNDFEGQFILVAADIAYICTKAVGGNQEAEVFAWDRTSGNDYNARYKAGSTECLSGFVGYGIPYIITKKGEIKRFTGQGFQTVANFPSVELGMEITSIHANGTVVDDNIVKILVRFGATTGTFFGIESMRVLDGIWNYDLNTGNLYHAGSVRDDSGNDFSQHELSDVGAMVLTNPTQGRYLIGAKAFQVYTGTTEEGIFTSDEDGTISTQQGYIITPKIQADDVKAFWRQIFLKYRRQLNSGDRIRVLYRTQESNTLPAYETITWVNATSFTGTNDDVVVGDFVEILAGANAGVIAKITAITDAAPNTFTITSDATLNAVTSTARVRYLPFIDLGTVSSQATQTEVFRMARKAPWIQFLIMFLGNEQSPALEGFIVDFKDKPL